MNEHELWEQKNEILDSANEQLLSGNYDGAITDLENALSVYAQLSHNPNEYPLTQVCAVPSANERVTYDPVSIADPITYALLQSDSPDQAHEQAITVFENYYSNPENTFHSCLFVADLLYAVNEPELAISQLELVAAHTSSKEMYWNVANRQTHLANGDTYAQMQTEIDNWK